MKIIKAKHPDCTSCGEMTKHTHWGKGPFKHMKAFSVRQCVNKKCELYQGVSLWYPMRGWLHTDSWHRSEE